MIEQVETQPLEGEVKSARSVIFVGAAGRKVRLKREAGSWLPEFTCQAWESGLCPAALVSSGGLEVGE